MDVRKITDELKKLYPGKNVIANDLENPTEIVCEVEPASWDPQRSFSVAVLDGKIKHYHTTSKQTYEVMKGVLEITKEGKTYFLSAGEKIEPGPEEYHIVKGSKTWVKITSVPAWTPENARVINDR